MGTTARAYRCRHCGRLVSAGSSLGTGRGLCQVHYRDRAVRALYPRLRMGPPPGRGRDRGPTSAEVEALVARQMANLPAWWDEAKPRE